MSLSETAPEPEDRLGDPETGGTLIIDLNAVEENFRALTRLLLTSECAAVVKANAYGLGLEPVTTKLANAGCRTFFVAHVAEARRLRPTVPDAAIYILNGPNTNLLGDREPEIYGYTTLREIGAMCAAQAKTHGLSTIFRQTNREGEIVDWFHEAKAEEVAGVGINPAGYDSHTGYQYDSISRVAGHRELAPPSKFSKLGGFNNKVFITSGILHPQPSQTDLLDFPMVVRCPAAWARYTPTRTGPHTCRH